MGFRGRITVVLAVTVALATGLVALLAVQTTRAQLFAELDRALVQLAAPGPTIGGQGPGRPPVRVRANDVVIAQLHTADGQVRPLAEGEVLAVPPEQLAAARAGSVDLRTVGEDGTPYRVLARPTVGDAVLVVAVDASEQLRVVQGLRWRFLLIGLVVSGVAALLGWGLAGRLVQPLRRLTTAAEEVAATGDPGVHGEIRSAAPDEAGRLSRAFDAMLGALAASRAQQQRLVDDAGHELRTPISSIRSNAEVLIRHPDVDEATRSQIAADMLLETEELTALVGALVDLAGVPGDEEDPGEVDLAATAWAATRRLPREQRALVSVTGQAVAVARPGQVHRAVLNVLTNATKFAPGSPVEVAVGSEPAGAQQPGGIAWLTVRDHGPGIRADALETVFERFARTDDARSVPGSGLGLAIVADIAHRNAGSVSAENHPEGGAVLTLRLPSA